MNQPLRNSFVIIFYLFISFYGLKLSVYFFFQIIIMFLFFPLKKFLLFFLTKIIIKYSLSSFTDHTHRMMKMIMAEVVFNAVI